MTDARAEREHLAAAAVDGFASLPRARRSGAPPAEASSTPSTRFRVLCAHRAGRSGVAGVNRLVEDALEARGLSAPREPWYVGRPVMVTRNDHGLRLYNGDVGIVLPDPGRPRRARGGISGRRMAACGGSCPLACPGTRRSRR